MGKWMMIAGAVILVVGALLHFAPQTLSWFGRLPGDIRIDNGNTKIFLPITSMLVISIFLTIVVNVFRR
ncbi:MAG: DUF2905 domain-containing protein [Woeseiaceae bacterium]|nr:DUF2905 domain-containing protein [Woeseiaceae bacterium]